MVLSERQRRAVERHLKPLRTYVVRLVRQRVSAEGLSHLPLPPEEVVNETVATVLRQGEGKQGVLPTYDWLRRVARGVVGREVARARERRLREVPLQTPVAPTRRIAGVQPEVDATLADVLPDPNAVLPLAKLERAEFERYLDLTFAELPHPWREMFLLHAVDGLSLEEIAHLQGRPVEAVIHAVSQTREFLRAKLGEEYDPDYVRDLEAA